MSAFNHPENATAVWTDALTRIRKIVAEKAGIETAAVTVDTVLDGSLDIDSLDRVVIIVELEREFNRDISDDDLESFRTVGDLVKIVTEPK